MLYLIIAKQGENMDQIIEKLDTVYSDIMKEFGEVTEILEIIDDLQNKIKEIEDSLSTTKNEICIRFTDRSTRKIKRWTYPNNSGNLKLCKSFLLKQELKHLRICVDNKVFK